MQGAYGCWIFSTAKMFDFGFSELLLIGIVGLVVLGPEKLPVVARTAGEWLGKAQRMVQQVKNDIEREAELSELKQIQLEAKQVADDLAKTVKGETDGLQKDLLAIKNDVDASAKEATDSFNALSKSAKPDEQGSELGEDGNQAFSDPTEDFYGWYKSEGEASMDSSTKTTFDKRYKSGPSIDELAEQIDRLKNELGDRSPQLGGSNRRFVARARTNRVRIYR